MALGQSHWVAGYDSGDLEWLWSIHSLQVGEALHWHFRAASDELEQIAFLSSVESLHYFPEPLDLRRVHCISVVLGSSLEVHNFEIWQTRDEKLQLLVCKNGNKFSWNYFVEAAKEGVHLLLDALVEVVIGFPFDVVLFVVVGEVKVSATWHKVDDLVSAEIVF